MAESIARHQREYKKGNGWIITLAGERHILHRDGIPLRALRRSKVKSGIQNRGVFTIVPRTVNFPIIAKEAPGITSTDYVWFVERDPSIKFDEESVNLAPRYLYNLGPRKSLSE